MNQDPVRVCVHPMLLEELRIRKETLEKKEGYAIRGGIPIVSKIAAMELKMMREGKKGSISICVEKIKGEKKIDLFLS